MNAARMNPDPLARFASHWLGPPGCWHDRYNARLQHTRRHFKLISKDAAGSSSNLSSISGGGKKEFKALGTEPKRHH